MTTETFNIYYLISQILIWGAMIGTLWVYHRQLLAVRAGSAGQNLISIVNFLQGDSLRDARTIVRGRLRDRNYKDWTEEEKIAADMVCSSYDVVSILFLQEKIVPDRTILQNWGPSIIDCYKILRPRIEEMQRSENSGPQFWDDFGLLEAAARRARP